jgi:ABC-type phosphate transport system substrate-binding protein
MKIKLTGAIVGVLACAVSLASPAMAVSTPPPGTTGFDNLPNQVLVGGSDTNYAVSNLFAGLYNQSPGCTINQGVNPVDNCDGAITQAGGATYANWDHDIISNAWPIGSGNGRLQLTGSLTGTNAIDLARSSSGIGSTVGVSLYEFASEGVAVVAVNPGVRGRTGSFNVTKAQLQLIYSTNAAACGAVTWAQLGDTGPNSADPVLPFGMNSGSGTFSVFNTYVGGTANTGACVSGRPFENDVAELKKIDAQSATDNLPRYNSGQGIWWASGATVSAFPVLSATLSPIPLETFGYSDTSTYPLVRNVSYVARTVDAAFPALGTGGGKPGAVREFLRWVCRSAATHTGDPTIQTQTTARNYQQQITGAIQRAGFNPTVLATTAGTSTFGRCRGK